MTCPECSDCGSIDRRRFVKLGGAAVVGAASLELFDAPATHAAPSASSAAETVVGRLYKSLSDQQKQAICLPFDHESRSRISANWHVADVNIGDDIFTKEQKQLVDQILRGITSEDGYERLVRQMEDDSGGLDSYSMAIFGEPGSGLFQWEMTGRHLTMRADGNSVDKAAFGGPLVYGHGEGEPSKNLFHYQTQMANEVFRAQSALLKKAPRETAVQLQGPDGVFPGIGVDQLTDDQRELLASTFKALLAPYREDDVNEVMTILKASGGLEQLHMAFYQERDLNSDGIWDIWRVEGPSLVWHFRGAPHVHAYINIGVTA